MVEPERVLVAAVSAPRETFDLGEIYRQHAQTVARWAARLGGPKADVEDLVHEVFVVAQRRFPEFRGDAKVTTWLYRITERVVWQGRRKERLRQWFGGGSKMEAEQVASGRPTPVDLMERSEASALVYRVLDHLPEKHRMALILFELEDLTGEEIAALMAAKVATVWVWLHRGRERFLAELERIEMRGP